MWDLWVKICGQLVIRFIVAISMKSQLLFFLRLTSLSSVLISASVVTAAEGPQADLQGFRSKVAPLLRKYCVDCHGPDLREAGLSLTSVRADLLAGDDLETWRMVQEQIRFGDMPPSEADQPTSQERRRLLGWIGQELLKTQQPGVFTEEKLLLPEFGNYVDHRALFQHRYSHVTPAPPRIWRVRPAIYEMVAPRLGEQVGPLSNALSRVDGSEFKDYAAAYFLDEASTVQLLANAKKIAAAQLGRGSKDRIFKKLVAGSQTPSEETVLAAIETGFRKALSRGPTKEEQHRFLGLYHQSLTIGGPKAAAESLLTAILMQPEFLFRQELGAGKPDRYGRVRLSQREIAYALSYALANAPLEDFLEAAEAGKLATHEQVATLVRERLQDGSPKYTKNPRIIQFFREYFHYPFAREVFKDQPQGGEHDASLLVADLELTIKEILKTDRRVLKQLLTTRKYYVNAGYGRKQQANQIVKRHERTRKYQTAFSLPLDWKWSVHLQPVAFREDERAGVLTHPAWLAAWSGNFENHPVQRGKWIRTRLLGGTVPDVPIGVDARVPEKEHTTFRDRLSMATRPAQCWRCHRKMDPLGLPFEQYDHFGRYQRLDAGQPVDPSGAIARTEFPHLHQKVSSPIELVKVLANSEQVEQVFVRHVFRFLLGRNETLGDANTLQDAHQAYRSHDGSLNELVVSLLSSDSFLLRQVQQPHRRSPSQPSRE